MTATEIRQTTRQMLKDWNAATPEQRQQALGNAARAAEAAQQIRVETYNLQTSTGRHIRKATQVVFPSGEVIRFMEKLSRREALRQVAQLPVR